MEFGKYGIRLGGAPKCPALGKTKVLTVWKFSVDWVAPGVSPWWKFHHHAFTEAPRKMFLSSSLVYTEHPAQRSCHSCFGLEGKCQPALHENRPLKLSPVEISHNS